MKVYKSIYTTTHRKTYFIFSAEQIVKLKISKKLNLVREQKKFWNMKMKVVPIAIGVLGMIT